MRKHLVWLLGLSLAVGVASIAVGANIHTMKAKVTPAKQSKTKYGPVSVDFTSATTCRQPCGGVGAIVPSRRLRIYSDDDVRIDTKGLPICVASQVQGTTTPQAKARCRTALIGQGATIAVIGGDPEAPLPGFALVFNGKPQGGRPTLLVHTRTPATALTTVLTSVVKPASGDYGTVLDSKIPPLPFNTALVSFQSKVHKTWTFRGKRHSYYSARCGDENRTWNSKATDNYGGGNPPLTATATQKCAVRR